MVFYIFFWWCSQVDNEFKEYKNTSNLKKVRSWNLRPKPNSIICFWASLLMLDIEDLHLLFYIWVPHTTIEVIVKKF